MFACFIQDVEQVGDYGKILFLIFRHVLGILPRLIMLKELQNTKNYNENGRELTKKTKNG